MGQVSKAEKIVSKNKYHDIERIEFAEDRMLLKVDGKGYSYELAKISAKLLKASNTERERHQFSPSGYGIHWPLLDEDLSIDGLLGIKHTPPIREKRSSATSD